METWRYSSIHA